MKLTFTHGAEKTHVVWQVWEWRDWDCRVIRVEQRGYHNKQLIGTYPMETFEDDHLESYTEVFFIGNFCIYQENI